MKITQEFIDRKLAELDARWERDDVSFDDRYEDLRSVLIYDIQPHLPAEEE